MPFTSPQAVGAIYRAMPLFLFQKIIVVNFTKVQPVSTTHEFMSCVKLTLYTTATQL